MKNLFIIDDDIHIGNMLEEMLSKEGYCIPKLLKLVGLEGTGKKKAKNFSLGMRARSFFQIWLLY